MNDPLDKMRQADFAELSLRGRALVIRAAAREMFGDRRQANAYLLSPSHNKTNHMGHGLWISESNLRTLTKDPKEAARTAVRWQQSIAGVFI